MRIFSHHHLCVQTVGPGLTLGIEKTRQAISFIQHIVDPFFVCVHPSLLARSLVSIGSFLSHLELFCRCPRSRNDQPNIVETQPAVVQYGSVSACATSTFAT
jgi:hypothetical protein